MKTYKIKNFNFIKEQSKL